MNTVISFKYLKPMAIVLPDGSMQQPVLRPTTKTVPGFIQKVPVHTHDASYVHKVTLLDEEPAPLPDYVEANPKLKENYEAAQGTRLAANHASNNAAREVLKDFEAKGYIEIMHDSFLDDGDIPKQESDYDGEIAPDSLAVQAEIEQQRVNRAAREAQNDVPSAQKRSENYPTSEDTDKKAADKAADRASKAGSKKGRTPRKQETTSVSAAAVDTAKEKADRNLEEADKKDK